MEDKLKRDTYGDVLITDDPQWNELVHDAIVEGIVEGGESPKQAILNAGVSYPRYKKWMGIESFRNFIYSLTAHHTSKWRGILESTIGMIEKPKDKVKAIFELLDRIDDEFDKKQKLEISETFDIPDIDPSDIEMQNIIDEAERAASDEDIEDA